MRWQILALLFLISLLAYDHLARTNRVLVSESLARRLWPGESPIDRTFTPVASGQATQPAPSCSRRL